MTRLMTYHPSLAAFLALAAGMMTVATSATAAITVYDDALQAPWIDQNPGQFHDLANTDLGPTTMKVDFTANDQRFAFYGSGSGNPNTGPALGDMTKLSMEIYTTAAGSGLDRIQMFLGDGDASRVEYDSGGTPLGWDPPTNTWTKYELDLPSEIPGVASHWTVDRLWLRNRFNDTEDFYVRNLQFEAPPQPVLTWTRPNTPDANTVALFHFEEGAGVTAFEAQGNPGQNLTLSSSGMWDTGTDFMGQAGTFINTGGPGGDYAANTDNTAFPTDYSNGLTLSFWAKSEDKTSGNKRILQYVFNSFQNENGLTFNEGFGQQFKPTVHDVTVPGVDFRPIDWTDGAWHHFAVVFEPAADYTQANGKGMGLFYMDNVLIGTWDATNTTNLRDTNKLILGIRENLSGDNFNGSIDELLIYNGVLSDFSDGFLAAQPAVPEPAAAGLVGLAMLTLLHRREG